MYDYFLLCDCKNCKVIPRKDVTAQHMILVLDGCIKCRTKAPTSFKPKGQVVAVKGLKVGDCQEKSFGGRDL